MASCCSSGDRMSFCYFSSYYTLSFLHLGFRISETNYSPVLMPYQSPSPTLPNNVSQRILILWSTTYNLLLWKLCKASFCLLALLCHCTSGKSFLRIGRNGLGLVRFSKMAWDLKYTDYIVSKATGWQWIFPIARNRILHYSQFVRRKTTLSYGPAQVSKIA